jgi:hypothetical protein
LQTKSGVIFSFSNNVHKLPIPRFFNIASIVFHQLSISILILIYKSQKKTISFMSILWKMAIFIEKPPVTSSNCFGTMKNASILIAQVLTGQWPL